MSGLATHRCMWCGINKTIVFVSCILLLWSCTRAAPNTTLATSLLQATDQAASRRYRRCCAGGRCDSAGHRQGVARRWVSGTERLACLAAVITAVQASGNAQLRRGVTRHHRALLLPSRPSARLFHLDRGVGAASRQQLRPVPSAGAAGLRVPAATTLASRRHHCHGLAGHCHQQRAGKHTHHHR